MRHVTTAIQSMGMAVRLSVRFKRLFSAKEFPQLALSVSSTALIVLTTLLAVLAILFQSGTPQLSLAKPIAVKCITVILVQ